LGFHRTPFAFPPMYEHLERYISLVSSVTGADVPLRFTQFATLFVGSLMRNQLLSTQHSFDPTVPRSIPDSHPQKQAVQSLLSLSSAVSTARVVYRFAGIPETIAWLRSVETMRAHTAHQRMSKLLLRLQCFTMLIYYPTEHVWFLGSLGLLPSGVDYDLFSRISCMAWAAYLLLDLWTLYRSRRHQISLYRAKLKKDGESQSERQPEAESTSIDPLPEYLAQQVRNVCDLILASHWSLVTGPLTDTTVGALGLCASLVTLYFKWKSTAV